MKPKIHYLGSILRQVETSHILTPDLSYKWFPRAVSSLKAFQLKIYIHLSYYPSVLHASPISFVLF